MQPLVWPGVKHRDQRVPAQLHFVAVVQDAADLDRRESTAPCSALFHHGRVGIHHHELRAGHFLHLGDARAMVAMRVADENDLDVAELEAELLDALLDQRHGIFEIGIDQDVALIGRDQERRVILQCRRSTRCR